MSYKQIIIIRKDLQMSPGKLAAQVSHASMAFLTNAVKRNAKIVTEPDIHYESNIVIDKDLYEKWILGTFTKVTLGARNKNQLLKAVEIGYS